VSADEQPKRSKHLILFVVAHANKATKTHCLKTNTKKKSRIELGIWPQRSIQTGHIADRHQAEQHVPCSGDRHKPD
jgi:hypothetical protein